MLDFPFNDPTCEKIFRPAEEFELAHLKDGHPAPALPPRTPWAAMVDKLGAQLETPSSPLLTEQERAVLLDGDPFAGADVESLPPAFESGLGSSTESTCSWPEQPGCLPCHASYACPSWEESGAATGEPMFVLSNLGPTDDGLTAEPVNEIVAPGLDFSKADAPDKADDAPTTLPAPSAWWRPPAAAARQGAATRAAPRHAMGADAASMAMAQPTTTPLFSDAGGTPFAAAG